VRFNSKLENYDYSFIKLTIQRVEKERESAGVVCPLVAIANAAITRHTYRVKNE
jgi:hypothetical protein